MSADILAGRYPLSTPDGTAIPLDIIKPLALGKIVFVAGGYTSCDIPAAYAGKLLVAYSSVECYISEDAVPVVPTVNAFTAKMIYIPAGVLIVFVAGAAKIAAIGVAAAGTLHIQVADTWAGLALKAQLNRI